MRKFLFFALFFVLAGTTLATTPVVIEDSEIAEMIDLCKKNNGFLDPDHIEVGQLILWEFPDNHKFKFLQETADGESLWLIAKNLLIITHDYHVQAQKVSTFAQAAPDSSSVKGKDAEAKSTNVTSGEQEENQNACLSRLLFVLSVFCIIAMFFALKRWKKII